MAVGQERHLDGVRGFAALIVVFGHCSNAGIDVIPGLDVHSSAKTGVWLFFVLSAYLLTRSLALDFSRFTRVETLTRYSARRVFRIMPLYAVVLLALWLAGQMALLDVFSHIALLEGFWHFWTIPVEMHFYFWLPVLMLAMTTLPAALTRILPPLILAASAVAYWYAGPQEIGSNSTALLNYLVFFAVGIFIANIRWRIEPRLALLVGAFSIAAIPIAAPRVVEWIEGGSIVDALEWSWLYAVIWGALLIAVINSTALQTAFAMRPLALIGRYSYGLYLTHFHIILLVREAALVPDVLKGAVALSLSLVSSAALFWLIEKPALAFGTRLSSRRGGGTSLRQNISPTKS